MKIESEGGKVKRFPARVRGAAFFSGRWYIAVAMLIAVLGTLVSCEPWAKSIFINATSVPIDLTVNGNTKDVLRPLEKKDMVGPFYTNNRDGPPTYTIKGYEFLPGKGNEPGWTDEGGSPAVYGGRGDLVFCVTYNWEEISAMNYTVTITRNVFPGQSSPDCLP